LSQTLVHRLQDGSLITFLLLAALGLRLWQRRRAPASGWVAVTFGALATGVLLSRVARLLPPDSVGEEALRVTTTVMIVAVPYLLFRFAESLKPSAPGIRRAADVASGLVIALVAVLTPAAPRAGEPRPGWYALYLGAVLLLWSVLTVYLAVRLWRGGRHQPTPSRRRIRLLATAALLLNAALLLSGTNSGGAEQNPTIAGSVQLLAIASGVVFGLAFAPPQVLRSAWRRPEEQGLRDAETGLMIATTRAEIADAVLPSIANLLGGGAAALYGEGGEQISHHEGADLPDHLPPTEVEDRHFEADRLRLPLRSATLLVRTSPYSPFFSDDEVELLRSIGLSVDLALSRLRYFEQERHARAALEQTNEELQALVYGISHDLRNPLVTVLGYIDLLRSDFAEQLGPEGLHFLHRIGVSAAYMDALIQDLLELSRIGRMQAEVEDVDLRRLLDDVVEQLAVEQPEATFELGDLPTVRMSPVRARQLFTNLFHNAVRHGGRADIRVSVSAEDHGPDGVVLSVADDGVGVPAQYHERLFGIFERLSADDSSEPTGTGIGLAICRKIVEQLGGSIGFAETSVGARVEIALPRSVLRPAAVMEVAR
jgi:signal transduction histidine kinase